MSEYLGRPLEEGEIVHHCNENPKDNRIENLELTLRTTHNKYHEQWLTLTCACGKIFKRKRRNTHFAKKGQKTTYCSRQCIGKFSRCSSNG